MKNILVLLIIYCFIACSTEQKPGENNPSGVIFQQKSIEENFAQAKKDNKLVLIDTYTDG
jgi:hypothetical protein